VSKSTIARAGPLEAPRDVCPYFEIMLDAIRIEAARIEKHSEQLFAYRKAVA
jgi:hypothetical protein